ncbi:hypothetical protein C6P44_005454 [Monosporozyma unispora]|nr:hypothetical protein C6P44_005454 [Kazachstania unispora]
MSSVENGIEYFDSLCELEDYSQTNYEKLQAVLKTLKKLLECEKSNNNDTEILNLLNILARDYEGLLGSSVDLRQAKYQARESEIQSADQMETDNHTRLNRTPFGDDLIEYIDVMEDIQRDSLRYTTIVERLSIDLAKQAEVSDPEVSKYDMNDWKPSKELQDVLDRFYDDNDKVYEINDGIKSYLDQIKLARAKYTLENKHQLQAKLSQLNKEVSHWRKEWDSMETLMFGDDPKSMKSMLHNIESLKQTLIEEKQQEQDDMDVTA